ncbi:hypothetical protein RZS08_20980, partial [Arthrospira platensis SPKY1]|nr:hypothetical protein [Arthrospira platensis SPKY1]
TALPTWPPVGRQKGAPRPPKRHTCAASDVSVSGSPASCSAPPSSPYSVPHSWSPASATSVVRSR